MKVSGDQKESERKQRKKRREKKGSEESTKRGRGRAGRDGEEQRRGPEPGTRRPGPCSFRWNMLSGVGRTHLPSSLIKRRWF